MHNKLLQGLNAVIGNIGTGDDQRNLGIHSLRHTFIFLTQCRIKCGLENPIDEVVMKDARMVTNTLARYRSDALTKVQFFKDLKPAEKWDHLLGPYKAMYCASESFLDVENSLNIDQLIDMCFVMHGKSFLAPKGFLDLQLQLQNTQNIHVQFEGELYQLWAELNSVYNAATDSLDFDIKKPSQGEPFLEQLMKLASLGRVAMYVPRRKDSDGGLHQRSRKNSVIAYPSAVISHNLAPTAAGTNEAKPVAKRDDRVALVNQRLAITKKSLPQSKAAPPCAQSSTDTGSRQYDDEYDKAQVVINELCQNPLEQGKEAREAIMEKFCISSFEEQCRLMKRCYELVPGYRTVIDSPALEISKRHIGNQKCRDYVKKFLKPAILCLKNHCGGDIAAFKAKCLSDASKLKQLIKEKADLGITLQWSKWARKCPCEL